MQRHSHSKAASKAPATASAEDKDKEEAEENIVDEEARPEPEIDNLKRGWTPCSKPRSASMGLLLLTR